MMHAGKTEGFKTPLANGKAADVPAEEHVTMSNGSRTAVPNGLPGWTGPQSETGTQSSLRQRHVIPSERSSTELNSEHQVQ